MNLELFACSVLAAATALSPAIAAEKEVDADSVVKYILSCEKPAGGFGPVDQPYAEVSRTYFAVATLELLGSEVPDPDKILRAKGVLRDRTYHSSVRGLHKANLCWLLGKPLDPKHLGSGHKWPQEMEPLENGGFGGHLCTTPYPKVHNTYYAVAVLSQGGRDLERTRELCKKTPEWLASRQNPDGSWNNFPLPGAAYVKRNEADALKSEDLLYKSNPTIGHVQLTWCAVKAYELLGVEVPGKEKTISWLQKCQGQGGGFTRAPGRGTEDVWETWAGVCALKVLGAEPRNEKACRTFLNSLQNADGGFGDRPGWRSRLGPTYHAVEALQALTGDARKAIESKRVPIPPPVEMPKADGMRIYTVFLKYIRQPLDRIVDGAHENHIDVITYWSVQYTGQESPSAPRQKYADSKGYGMTIIDDSATYRRALYFEGTGLAQHDVGDLVWPPGVGFDMGFVASAAGGVVRYEDLGERLAPLLDRGGLHYWGGRRDEEAMERIGFDDSVDGKGCYDAIAMGAQDEIRDKPWYGKYVGRIPVMHHVLSMSIEEIPPQSHFLRTLFVARSPGYADFVEAVKANRVVAVHGWKDPSYYGKPEWVKYVKSHEKEWRDRWPEPPESADRFKPR